MKALKVIFICLYILICASAFIITGMIYYFGSGIESNYKITKGTGFSIESRIPVTTEYKGALVSECEEIDNVGSTLDVEVKLFGVIPIKSTTLQVVEDTYVAVLGSPFGIKMFTDGVLVVDTDSVETLDGNKIPAHASGIKKGDYIISINGKKVSTNEDVGDIVSKSKGESLKIVIRRKGENLTVTLKPVLCSEDNTYKAGIWVKDSTAGIGTLTFYSPYNDIVCGLGHGMYSSETGNVIDFRKGELVGAQIISVVKGTSGIPGELKGKLNYTSIGKLYCNEKNGVYGNATCIIDSSNLTRVAHRQEVKNGAATIICTVDDTGPQYYSCQIKVGSFGVNDTVQNMMVTITDKKLIELTGGIVQGMSGSPIVQDGKLVGALTHVLIDDPTEGYAIFAENMLETAQSVAEGNKLKDAS